MRSGPGRGVLTLCGIGVWLAAVAHTANAGFVAPQEDDALRASTRSIQMQKPEAFVLRSPASAFEIALKPIPKAIPTPVEPAAPSRAEVPARQDAINEPLPPALWTGLSMLVLVLLATSARRTRRWLAQ